jgi:hypothetical protein
VSGTLERGKVPLALAVTLITTCASVFQGSYSSIKGTYLSISSQAREKNDGAKLFLETLELKPAYLRLSMRLSTLGSALVGLAVAQASTINYTTVTGYFLQDEESTDPTTFDYVSDAQILANQNS